MKDIEKLKTFNEENKTDIDLNTNNIILSKISITENSLKNLFSINFPNIQSISLNNLSLTNLQFLSDVQQYPLLKSLSLDDNQLQYKLI